MKIKSKLYGELTLYKKGEKPIWPRKVEHRYAGVTFTTWKA